MGAVYEVEHVQLGVHYALKTFTLEEGHVETLKSKFLAEGKVLARLRNPNLVHVFDLNFDEKAGILYFVMDLVLSEDGNPHTLADVKTAELDEDRILQWFTELAAAVDYIHERGLFTGTSSWGMSCFRRMIMSCSPTSVFRIFSRIVFAPTSTPSRRWFRRPAPVTVL